MDWQCESERASFAPLALDRNRTAQPLDQPLADGQPQPCPFVLSRQAGVKLAEGLEQLIQILTLDAKTGVGHGNAECGMRNVACVGADFRSKRDFALLGA